ncbi:helix-turn-helix transcriptional regulator [Caldifermentibacillus hisashii]|jgi:putative transcriptional regulator|uniref:Transcriptional regulator n=2 Tax=Bacillales TaxID=1385 RepID=A0A6G9J1G4_9BACL|nr:MULTISPECIES: helix-turn-helix transcriptional regulator [Bacillaceae]MBB3868702.1 putative transcriptional regulator [Parageobacillus toebii NBRC 107807]QIQ32019.1 helix-turn-helix transcriptional regulator [Parageobacillus toebii NBRC 107807]RLP86053.1 XRE family transcriptional regulator [Geobacillus stearothermophilus]
MKIVFKDAEQFQITLIRKGFSQRQFSKKIGISEAYLHQIINQKKNPSPAVAKKITEHLELDFDDIFTVQI